MSSLVEPQYAELESEIEQFDDKSEPLRPVTSQPHDWTISTLRDKYERGQINLQPHYQREYVWDQKPELPSRLVESLLLQIPIPPLYFVKLKTGKIEVVDGQQRLTSLIRFTANEFKLQKLQKLSHLNGKLYKDLSEEDHEKIADAAIRSIVIDAGDNAELRYEIFERLNRGAMALNEQEIRNCSFRGNFCDLLATLEKHTSWRSIKGGLVPEPRFVEREMILRFFAFSARMDHYTGNLKKFLNDYMGKYAPDNVIAVSELKNLFEQTIDNVSEIFEGNAARIYTTDNTRPYSEGYWENKFSISALDIQASALVGHSLAKLKPIKENIVEAYKFYMATNPQIRLAITQRPAARDATKNRWFGFKSIVNEILSLNVATAGHRSLMEPKALFRAGYHLGAGAMAGVVLERHLKNICATQDPVIAVNGKTISPLNEALKAAAFYDGTEARRVHVYSDIRNRCSHSVENQATNEEVWELICGVERFIEKYPLSKLNPRSD